MILHDIADRTDLFIEMSTTLHSERLGHGDLHAVNIVPVPDRLEERVGEPEVEQILDRFLTQVMIDSENRRFWEGLLQNSVKCLGGDKVAAKRFFHDNARSLVAA